MPLSRIVIVAAVALAGTGASSDWKADLQSREPAELLEALAGEWSVVSEARLGPNAEPVRIESRESARMIGTWLVAESTGTAGGAPFTSILTLGYVAHQERFAGTWISSRQTHMWSYRGVPSESGRSVTLETEGPILGDPSRTARYREVIELEGPDTKVMRSMIMGPDGEWFEFQRAVYQRNEIAGTPSAPREEEQ
jgi:hypothetical protein